MLLNSHFLAVNDHLLPREIPGLHYSTYSFKTSNETKDRRVASAQPLELCLDAAPIGTHIPHLFGIKDTGQDVPHDLYAQTLTRQLWQGQGLDASGLTEADWAIIFERILAEHFLPPVNPGQPLTLACQGGDEYGLRLNAADSAAAAGMPASAPVPQVPTSEARHSRELSDCNKSLASEKKLRNAAERALAFSKTQNQDKLKDSKRVQRQLRSLSRQLLAAQEQERRAISRELHDVIGQILTGITLQLSALNEEAKMNTRNLSRRIALTQRMVNRSIEMVHSYARELRPALLNDLGLEPALRDHLKTLSRRSSVAISVTVDPEVDSLDEIVRTTLYRVGQEALTNVARHAEAKSATLTILREGSVLRMVVRDDGKGFSVNRASSAEHNKRLGLVGMRERVEMIHGHLTIVSTPDHGTTITVDIPVAA